MGLGGLEAVLEFPTVFLYNLDKTFNLSMLQGCVVVVVVAEVFVCLFICF